MNFFFLLSSFLLGIAIPARGVVGEGVGLTLSELLPMYDGLICGGSLARDAENYDCCEESLSIMRPDCFDYVVAREGIIGDEDEGKVHHVQLFVVLDGALKLSPPLLTLLVSCFWLQIFQPINRMER